MEEGVPLRVDMVEIDLALACSGVRIGEKVEVCGGGGGVAADAFGSVELDEDVVGDVVVGLGGGAGGCHPEGRAAGVQLGGGRDFGGVCLSVGVGVGVSVIVIVECFIALETGRQ